jgi:DNA-3-methyladenine glycosylase II
MRIITSQACVDEGAAYLAALDDRFERALALTQPLPLRLTGDGFSALLRAIVSQQISVAAAAAIWARVQAAGMDDPARVWRAGDDDLKACGLSRPKVKYVRALARARLDYPALRGATSQQVVETLVQVPGIGKWPAEIYAMFSLGHADVFAPGDLALQESARMLFGLEKRPTEAVMRKMAQDWSPWRAVAARLLFAYYRVAKQREGLIE